MKGNERIALTAEAVAFMRTRENSDKFSQYFVSPQTQKRFKLVSWFVPSSYLNKLSHRRISLSRDLDKLVRSYNPEQIIELACGYSPRGLVMTQRDPKLVYVETDFSSVIERKKRIIEGIEGLKLSKNHHLIGIDAIDGDLYDSLKGLISKKKRTLVIAETLASYLNPSQYNFLMGNVEKLLDKVEEGAYLSHEGKHMLPGFFGKLLLFYRDRVAKTKSYKHFTNPQEIEEYFLSRGYEKVKVVDSEESNNVLYLANRK